MQTQKNRRVYERHESTDLVDLEIYNKEGSFIYRTMGLVRNVGLRGLLVETHMALNRSDIVVTTLELDGELIETTGKTVHVNPCGKNHYCNGIEFLKNPEQITLKDSARDSAYPVAISESGSITL